MNCLEFDSMVFQLEKKIIFVPSNKAKKFDKIFKKNTRLTVLVSLWFIRFSWFRLKRLSVGQPFIFLEYSTKKSGLLTNRISPLPFRIFYLNQELINSLNFIRHKIGFTIISGKQHICFRVVGKFLVRSNKS